MVELRNPDDDVKLRKNYHETKEPDYERKLVAQPRPNLLFEAGMAIGRNLDSTVLVQLGDVKSFSDVGGRHVVHLSNSPTSRQALVTKLANAACNVDTPGCDWLTAGHLKPR